MPAAREKLLSFFPSPGFCDEEMHFFLLTDLRDRLPGEAAPHQDPDEILNVKEFSVQTCGRWCGPARFAI